MHTRLTFRTLTAAGLLALAAGLWLPASDAPVAQKAPGDPAVRGDAPWTRVVRSTAGPEALPLTPFVEVGPHAVPAASPDGRVEYAAGELLVRVDEEAGPDARAALHRAGAAWIQRGERSRVWRVGFPADRTPAELLAAVRDVPGLQLAVPNAIARGAAKGGGGGGGGDGSGGSTGDPAPDPAPPPVPVDGSVDGPGCGPADLLGYQWERAQALTPAICPSTSPLPPVTIAVVDSGVAYETISHAGLDFVAVPELQGVPIVSPWDFVDGDALPLDHHQHGTHIAGIIASRDRLRGHAPNPILMPVRVLDENNVGTEFTVAEGIHWAAEQGAEVINLSLSFGLAYLPTAVLADAIQAADEAGAVLVAAAGNDAEGAVSFPAAHPSVIAVTAGALDSQGGLAKTSYSNEGYSLVAIAPGGSLQHDRNGDSVPDAIVAQTVTPGAPDDIGYWAMGGTSQAAAVTSSQVAQLLSQGVPPEEIQGALQDLAATLGTSPALSDKWGEGLPAVSADIHAGTAPAQYFVNAVAAVVQKRPDRARLEVQVEVIDAFGNPPPNKTAVYMSFRGSSTGSVDGTTNLDGIAVLGAKQVDVTSSSDPLFWMWSIDAVAPSDDPESYAHRPGTFYRLPEGTGSVIEQILAGPGGDSGVIFSVTPSEPTSCEAWGCASIQESYSMPALGGGFSSSTLNVSFNTGYLDLVLGSGFSSSTLNVSLSSPLWFPWGSSSSASYSQLQPDGSGFSSSTLNVLTWDSSMLGAWGSGFSSSTLLFNSWGGSYLDEPALSPTGSWSALGSGFSSSTLNLFSLSSWAIGAGLQPASAPLGATMTDTPGAVPVGL